MIRQLINEHQNDDHCRWARVLLDFLEEKVHEGEGFRGPRLIVVFLHAVQNLFTRLSEVERVATILLEVDDACFGLAVGN